MTHERFIELPEELIKMMPEQQANKINTTFDDGDTERLRYIIRNLLTLKWHKDTFGKTPEYLTHQPKAWAEAMEAVKS